MSNEAPRRKRLKIALACTACRIRKIRCDGAQPICAACTKRNASSSCSYKRASTIFRSQQAPTLRPAQDRVIGSSVLNHPKTASTGTAPSCMTSSAATLRRQSFGSDAVDGLVTIGSHGDHSPYGQSSTIAFVRQVAQGYSTDSTSREATRATDRREQQGVAQSTTSLYSRDERSFILPQRSLADDFVECFWAFVHPVFPILHKKSLLQDYNKLWSSKPNSNTSEVYFIPILNLMFALGCQYSSLVDVRSKSSMAMDFYMRSRKSFIFDILDAPSLDHVQLLLLMGVYLQSSQYGGQCWNTIGLAIRSAQGLGLHLEREGSHASDQLERELVRRVWHNCICLDRLLSMTFGRRPMITTSRVPLPAMIDDEYLHSSDEGTQPPNIPSYLGLFVFSCKLFEVLKDILDTFYTEDIRSETDSIDRGGIVASALAFNRQLDEFHASVPNWLRASIGIDEDGASKQSSLHLQQQVLYCRFLYTRVLSLRPLLLLPSKQNVSVSLEDDVLRSCCCLCLDSARELIETIYANLDTLYRSSGWHSVYFTFAAATVLLAASKEPATDMVSTDLVWSKGLSILEHYKDQISSASKAIRMLQTLKEQGRFHQSGRGMLLQTARDADTGSHLSNDEQPPQFSQFNALGTISIEDAWFGQQFLNLDWLELDESTF